MEVGDEQESEESGEEEGEEEGMESDLVRTVIACLFSSIVIYILSISEIFRLFQSTESSLKRRLKKKTKADSAWLRPTRKRKRRIKAKGLSSHTRHLYRVHHMEIGTVVSNIQLSNNTERIFSLQLT